MSDPTSNSAAAWAGHPASQQAIHTRLMQVMPAVASRLVPNATLTECGSDSLDLVELLCVADTDYGVRLSIDEVASLPTVGALVETIDRRATRRPSAPSP